MSKTTTTKSVTLKDLAGTGRGLGAMTVEDLQALLGVSGSAKVSGVAKSARRAKAADAPKAPKEPTAFYKEVIVGKREQRAAAHHVNTEAAAWMRQHGLVPSGQAWTAVKHGERGIKTLQALNAQDGLVSLVAKGAAAKATQQDAKPAVRTSRKAKAASEPEVIVTPAPSSKRQEAIDALVMSGAFTAEEAERAIA